MAWTAGLDLVALVSVVGSSIIGFSGLYFTYKARTNVLRERLHSEQIALIGEALEAGYDITVRAISVYKLKENPAAFEALGRDCREDLVRLQRLTVKSRMILPADSVDALHAWTNDITKLVGTKRKEDLPKFEDNMKSLEKFYDVTRADLGIDKLSEETRALLK